MGLFIAFEGIEGCGKSTQIKLLERYLSDRKLGCTVTREPGGTPVGEAIRKIFLHSGNSGITPLTELLLVTASRVQHVHEVITPALRASGIVLCDRFYGATVAYQGYAGGVPLGVISRCHELFLESLQPDLTLLLDCPVPVGLTRSRERNRAAGLEISEGRFEEKDLNFHERVRQGYLEQAAQASERFEIINAEGEVGTVHGQVCRAVDAKLKGRSDAV